jgi:DNA-binding transcriptional LysR family regulator
VMIPLFRDAVALMVSADSVCEPTALAEAYARLRAEPLILAGRVAQSQQILRTLLGEMGGVQRVINCGDLHLVKSLTETGLGVGVLPCRVATRGGRSGVRFLHSALPQVPDTIYLVFRADLPRSRAALRLKDALSAHGSALELMWPKVQALLSRPS